MAGCKVEGDQSRVHHLAHTKSAVI